MGIRMIIRNEAGNDLTREMVFRIVLLHELGLPQRAIQQNFDELYHVNVPIKQISGITDKADRLVEEWLARLMSSI